MSRKTICLNMIVKNESKIIRETLNNICKYIKFDYWVISDTGSTDNTIEIIKSFFKEKEIPGEMHVNTWKDFGHNRSIALELAYNKTDYVFIFDADDKICGNFKLPVLKSDQYFLTFGENDIKYDRSILVNNRKKWIFKGVLHEFIHSDEQIKEKTTIKGEYYILSGRTSNRNQDANKYKRDAEILEKAFNDKNTEADLLPRYSFYLAQSYKDNSDVSNAIKWYTKTLDLNGWVQEKYYSCVMLGDLHLQQGNDKDALKFWLKSVEYDSERIEGIVKACEWGYKNSNHCLVNALYHRFRKYNKNPQGKLFLFFHLYNYHLEYYNSISSFYVNDKQSGYESCKNIMLYKGYKWEHTFSNFMYYFDYFKKDKKNEILVNKIKEYLLNRTISLSKRKDLWDKIKDYLKKHKKVWREIDREMGKNYIIKKNEYSSSNKILIYTGLMYFPWNDSYMETHPLGGAEKAVVYLSRNLPKNYDIYISGKVKDETKDNITYIHHDKLQDLLDKEVFHTIIVSRYVYFFVKYFNIKCYQLLLSAHDSTGFINNMYRSITIDDILRDNNEHIDKVVSLTSWHSNNIISRHPYLSNKINIINNGIDINNFPENKEKIKNKFMWSSCSYRGLHILLNLWEDILQKLPDATLDICSYDTFPKNDADRKMLEIINKHSSIIHHGKLDTTQLYDLMNISEYWLYTNTFPETSCITGMEMLMSNVICIYYPLAGLVDTVGKYGIPVEKGDEIETILSLTEKQKVEIIEKGKQYALKCSWENRAKEWSKMLNLTNNKIGIFNSFPFHYEMFGFILNYALSNKLQVDIFTETYNNLGWLDFYKDKFNNFNIINYTKFKGNTKNYSIFFVTTDDDPKWKNDWSCDKVVCLNHYYKIRNSNFKNYLNIARFKDSLLPNVYPCYPLINYKEKKQNTNICIIGGGGVYLMSVINRLCSKNKIRLNVFTRKIENCNIKFNSKFDINLIWDIQTSELIEMLNNSSYVLVNYNTNQDHNNGISCSGSVQLALSTLCKPIIVKSANKYLQIENALEFDIDLDNSINLDSLVDFKSIEEERNKYIRKFDKYIKNIT